MKLPRIENLDLRRWHVLARERLMEKERVERRTIRWNWPEVPLFLRALGMRESVDPWLQKPIIFSLTASTVSFEQAMKNMQRFLKAGFPLVIHDPLHSYQSRSEWPRWFLYLGLFLAEVDAILLLVVVKWQ